MDWEESAITKCGVESLWPNKLTKNWPDFKMVLSGNNSVVECNLAKVEVGGSNPLSRSIFPLGILELPVSEKSGNNLALHVKSPTVWLF